MFLARTNCKFDENDDDFIKGPHTKAAFVYSKGYADQRDRIVRNLSEIEGLRVERNLTEKK